MVTLSPTISLFTQRRMASMPRISRRASLTYASSAKVATIASASKSLTARMCSATTPVRLVAVAMMTVLPVRFDLMGPASTLPPLEGQARARRQSLPPGEIRSAGHLDPGLARDVAGRPERLRRLGQRKPRSQDPLRRRDGRGEGGREVARVVVDQRTPQRQLTPDHQPRVDPGGLPAEADQDHGRPRGGPADGLAQSDTASSSRPWSGSRTCGVTPWAARARQSSPPCEPAPTTRQLPPGVMPLRLIAASATVS